MIVNLPNMLTLLRILVIPVVVGLYYYDSLYQEDWARWTAWSFYAVAAITDFFDGYLARRSKQVSEFGRFLDPIADKLLVTTMLFILMIDSTLGGVHVFAAIIILIREIVISGLREFLAGVELKMPVSQLAKWKTVVQMFAIGFLIVGRASPEAIPSQLIGETGLWIAAALTVITGWDYLKAGWPYIKGTAAKPEEKPAAEETAS